MKVAVDANLCTGCTLCCDIAADIFEMGDDGLAKVKVADVSEDLSASAQEAADSCPVSAITLG